MKKRSINGKFVDSPFDISRYSPQEIIREFFKDSATEKSEGRILPMQSNGIDIVLNYCAKIIIRAFCGVVFTPLDK